MAKKTKRRRSRNMTIPLGVTLPLIPPVIKAYHVYEDTNSFESGIRNYVAYYTGYTGNPAKAWEWEYMKTGAFPLLAGFVAHKLAGRFGINRMLGSAGVPIVRI